MRERIALGISALAIAILVVLSSLFAAVQNKAGPREPTAAADAPPLAEAVGQDSVRGRELFAAHGCERCHSVAGTGSPRYPLDGVGARRTVEELRAWTIAEEAVLDSLSPSAARAKRRYQEMAAEELESLLAYLASLRRGR